MVFRQKHQQTEAAGLHRQALMKMTTMLTLLSVGVSSATVFNAIAPAQAARSLTEQLHTPPQDSLRQQRDVADEFLLLGQEHLSLGNYDSAITALQEAANAYHYLGDFVGMGEAYEQLVKVHSTLGQYDAAEQIVRQQLAIARSNQNVSDQILALNNLGTLHLQAGDLETAHAVFLEGLTVSQDIDSDSGIGLSLSNLGLISAAQGQLNDARKYYEVAVGYRVRARDYAGASNTDSNLGDVYLANGQVRQAIGAYRVALSRAKNIADPYLQLRALDGLIAIYRDRSEPGELSNYLNERIALTRQTGDDWQRLLTLQTIGEIHQDQGDWQSAQDAFSRALSLARALDRKQIQADLTNRLIWLSSQLN